MESDQKKLCFSTYVYGPYQDYIPSYIYSILWAFPQHFVKIFVEEPLSLHNKNCLELIRRQVSDRFEVIDSFTEFVKYKLPHRAAYRFLLGREHFQDFDCVYLGDVDFIIYNQFNDQFIDTYLQHCRQTGLPFSNEWNYDYGRYRMMGLHFIIKDAYFDNMDYWIEDVKYGNVFTKRCIHHPLWPSYDEEMLYYMASHAFDLRPLIGYRRPYHGLHFGTFRVIDISNSFATNHIHITDGRNKLPQWLNDHKKIDAIMSSDLFREFYKGMCPEAKAVVRKAKFALHKKMF